MIVAVAGDWHGNIPWARQAIQRLDDLGIHTCYHVGDFGIWPGPAGKRWLTAVETAAAAADLSIYVTPGNHEDWARLDTRWTSAPGEPIQLSRHIAVLPRGYRWNVDGRSFVSFGGGASIDFELRIAGQSWWPSELPTEADAAAAIAGGRADVMLSHDAPLEGTPAVQRARDPGSPGRQWSRAARDYAALSADRITKVFAAVTPQLLVHGHFHVRNETILASGQHILSLAADNQPGNLALLDLEDLSHQWID